MITPGIAVIALAVVVLINSIYYLYFIKAFTSKKQTTHNTTQLPVSIIVCAKNEEKNLQELVPLLLEQDYPDFEIILINDASIDDTLLVIDEFCEQDQRVKKVDVINNENFWGNKKYALTLGIKKAVNNQLLFIDADCRPASPQWVKNMSQHLENKEIVLGYGGYEKRKHQLLNALIRYETGLTALQYMSYAQHNNPYMGVGRNLAYTASLFYQQRGFMNHMNVLGGDDDLFVNQAANKTNTTIEYTPDSFTISKPKETWNAWWQQKKRHINTATHYKKKHQITLGLFYVSQIGFFAAAICAFLWGYWPYALALVLLRYTIVWIAVGMGVSRFRESDLIPIIPILEITLIVLQLGLYLNNKIAPPKRWK